MKSPVTCHHLEFSAMTEADLDAVMAIEITACPFPWGKGMFEDSLASQYQCHVLKGVILKDPTNLAPPQLPQTLQVLAYSVVMSVLDEAQLLCIAVDPRYFRLGLGKKMLGLAIDEAMTGGAEQMFLEVRESNVSALALYSQMGFKEIGIRKNYYPALSGREHARVMRLPLTRPTSQAVDSRNRP